MLMKGSIALKYYFLNQLFKNFKKKAGGKLKFVIEKKARLQIQYYACRTWKLKQK